MYPKFEIVQELTTPVIAHRLAAVLSRDQRCMSQEVAHEMPNAPAVSVSNLRRAFHESEYAFMLRASMRPRSISGHSTTR